MSQIIRLIEAVDAVERLERRLYLSQLSSDPTGQLIAEYLLHVDALRRIPPELRGTISFFSVHDLWLYHAVMDNNVCEACAEFQRGEAQFKGTQLRFSFPDLEITNEDRIEAMVHPNCRCWLERLSKQR